MEMKRRSRQRGFTFIETLMVLAVTGILAGVAVPPLTGAMRRYDLSRGRQTVAAEIRSARFAAITTNRTLRVRFNCPTPGQYRIVEVVNDPAIDNAADRCSETAYPFPDPDPAVAPNADGPARWLADGTQFGAFQDFQITNRGRVTPLAGCPACAAAAPPAVIALTNGYATQTITVSAGGQVQLP